MPTPHTTLRLGDEDRKLFAELEAFYGLSLTGVVKMLVRKECRWLQEKRAKERKDRARRGGYSSR